MRRDYRRSGKSASPSSDKTSAKTRETTADLAREYRKRGLQPVPIPKGSKGPRDEGWPHLEVTEGNIDRLFTAGQNIGIQLGKRSGGLVDVDLDCAEAVALAPHILPSTHAVFGRKSKPKSHYFFIARDETEAKATVQFKGPKQDMLVELRIGGGDKAAQTMAPGSVHPASGEDVRWDSDGAPSEVGYNELKNAVKQLAVAVLILRNYPPKGLHARHNAALALGGFLARVGWDVETISDFMEAVATEAGDDEIADRRKAATHAAEAHGRGENSFGFPELIKYVGDDEAKVIAKWLEYRETDQAALIEQMNERYAVVPIAGKVRVMTFDSVRRPDGQNQRLVATFYGLDDFRALLAHQKITVTGSDGKSKTIGRSAWWLAHPDRRQYEGLIFRPEQGDVIDGRLNLWRGWGVEPKAGDWSLLRAHMRDVLAGGSEAVYSYIERWTAWAFQNPSLAAEVALTLQGGRGTGKGIFARALCDIFGQHGLQISSMDQITGRFNAHLMDCALLFGDEAYWPGNKGAEGQFKRLITEPSLAIERKGVDIFSVDNCLHIIIASNEPWVVPAGVDERRFMVVRVSEHRKQNVSYFRKLHAEMYEAGGLGAMLHDLLTLDLGGWHPREDIPRTDALDQQKLLSLSPADQWWLEMLRDGCLPGAEADKPRRAPGYLLFKEARDRVPALKFFSDHLLGNMLKEHGCNNSGGRWKDTRHRAWNFPRLREARAAFAKKLPIQWGDDAADWGENATGEDEDDATVF